MSTETLNASAGTRDFNDFIYPGVDVLTEPFTVASGQVIAKYEIVARSSSTGKISTYSSGGSNGLNVPYAIAIDDIDATGGDVVRDFYVKGAFNEDKAVLSDTGDTFNQTVYDALRDRGIYLKNSVGA